MNHFPKSFEITKKDNLNRNISKMEIDYGKKNFYFIPKTYIFPKEFSVFLADAERNRLHTYICKPSFSSRGRGIFLTDSIDEIREVSNSKYVVSHYLDNPMLINGYKYDLRVYVCITSINPLRIYIYNEGIVRFATEKYTTKKLNNLFIHLTNFSINKYNEK